MKTFLPKYLNCLKSNTQHYTQCRQIHIEEPAKRLKYEKNMHKNTHTCMPSAEQV